MAATMPLSPPRLASLTLLELTEVDTVVSFSGGGLSRPVKHQLFKRNSEKYCLPLQANHEEQVVIGMAQQLAGLQKHRLRGA